MFMQKSIRTELMSTEPNVSYTLPGNPPTHFWKVAVFALVTATLFPPRVLAVIPATSGLPTQALRVLYPPSQVEMTVLRDAGGRRMAPHALWQWGKEVVMLAGAAENETDLTTPINQAFPSEYTQARSVDEGVNWTPEAKLAPSLAASATRLQEPLDFAAANLTVLCLPAKDRAELRMYVSDDRCKTWRGPYTCVVDGVKPISLVTDFVRLNSRECLMLGTAAKVDGAAARVFCARTTDGGLSWRLVSWIGVEPAPSAYAAAPSSLKTGRTGIVTSLLRCEPGKAPCLEIWRSEDFGAHWFVFGKPSWAIGAGDSPSLVRLVAGRLAITYGYRLKPHGVRARISEDDGYTWGSEIVLRAESTVPLARHAKTLLRSDGRVLTVHATDPDSQGKPRIDATLWAAPTTGDEAKLHQPQMSVLTNDAIWKGDAPVGFTEVTRPPVENVFVSQPVHEWTYSHHQSITFFKGRLYALWSNGRQNEDDVGQRIMLSSSADFYHWTPPTVLVDSATENGIERVLTAGGFHDYNGTLVAYLGNYGPNKETTRLQAVTSTDGVNWSAVKDMGIPFCPNHGPQKTSKGRLIMAGMMSFPYTDDPGGLSGWTMSGIYPREMIADLRDDPATFREGAARNGWPVAVCEGSFFETSDGLLHMGLRNDSRAYIWTMWETISRDQGITWSPPMLTKFSNGRSKFHFGQLPDGRFYCVSNPLLGNRNPLVVSVSTDGVRFNRQFVIGEAQYEKRRPGLSKGGDYSYPHSRVHDGSLYVIVARQKEAEQVIRVKLSDLTK